jgi:hypothetical protein
MADDPASLELSDEQWKAGQEYLTSLQRLGLDPECLFWCADLVVGHNVLILATSTYELAGPTAIARTLFKAYNASATPRTLNPFLVRIHSLDHGYIQATAKNRVLYKDLHDPIDRTFIGPRDMYWKLSWFYKFSVEKKSARQVERNWMTYQRNVEKLAA